jgi:hypothetical protein
MKCAAAAAKADSFFFHGHLEILHNDGELLTICLCCLQDSHDFLHCGYEGDHVSISAAFVGRCFLVRSVFARVKKLASSSTEYVVPSDEFTAPVCQNYNLCS